MSVIAMIERSMELLTVRVQRLHNGDFASLSYHSGGWHCSSCFTGIHGNGDTPLSAMQRFEDELARREKGAVAA